MCYFKKTYSSFLSLFNLILRIYIVIRQKMKFLILGVGHIPRNVNCDLFKIKRGWSTSLRWNCDVKIKRGCKTSLRIWIVCQYLRITIAVCVTHLRTWWYLVSMLRLYWCYLITRRIIGDAVRLPDIIIISTVGVLVVGILRLNWITYCAYSEWLSGCGWRIDDRWWGIVCSFPCNQLCCECYGCGLGVSIGGDGIIPGPDTVVS